MLIVYVANLIDRSLSVIRQNIMDEDYPQRLEKTLIRTIVQLIWWSLDLETSTKHTKRIFVENFGKMFLRLLFFQIHLRKKRGRFHEITSAISLEGFYQVKKAVSIRKDRSKQTLSVKKKSAKSD